MTDRTLPGSLLGSLLESWYSCWRGIPPAETESYQLYLWIREHLAEPEDGEDA